VGALRVASDIAVLALISATTLLALLVVWRDDHSWEDRSRL
jgi:hypothetical protein